MGIPEIDLQPDGQLQFLYLKRSAEEGFVTAQHNLGLAYHTAKHVKRNDLRALGWLRESVRNGNPTSYLLAGDLLSHHHHAEEGDESQGVDFSKSNV